MNVRQTNINSRKALLSAGYRGDGLVFCVIDTGVCPVRWLKGKVTAGTSDGLKDGYNHGTFVAGQLIEWCPDAEVISYKVFDDNGCGKPTSTIIEALKDVFTRAQNDRNRRYITNMSLTWPMNKGSEEYHKVKGYIDALTEMDCPVVCAAGNTSVEGVGLYPSCFESPFTASAIDEMGLLANFSTFHDEVDHGEFGVNVPGISNKGDDVGMSGTSMASPNLAGKIGLLMCMHKQKSGVWPTDAWIVEALKSMSIDLRTNGKDPYTGWGFVELKEIDVEKAVDTNVLRITNPYTCGALVREVQELLAQHGYQVEVDGIYGTETETAVKAFQKDNELTVDGVVTDLVLSTLKEESKEVEDLKEEIYFGVCTGNSVNVRNGASVLYGKIGVAHKGDKLLVRESSKPWPEVALVLRDNLCIGYMSPKYIKKMD